MCPGASLAWPFSSVILLFNAGVTLSIFYIGDPTALYGTSYGIPTYLPRRADIAWSEYNHHWAGLVVLIMGIWRCCPLSLVFVDPAVARRLCWACRVPSPSGRPAELAPWAPADFGKALRQGVAQHRLFALVILLFAVFEWRVQTGRIESSKPALVFPAVCALGGALLLTHMHAVANLKEELLAELTHTPLALLAVTAGWARWLDLRFPGPTRKSAAHIWPVCFALIGVVLLLYREA